MEPFLIILALLAVFVIIIFRLADAQPKPHLDTFLNQQKAVRQQIRDKFTRLFQR